MFSSFDVNFKTLSSNWELWPVTFLVWRRSIQKEFFIELFIGQTLWGGANYKIIIRIQQNTKYNKKKYTDKFATWKY